MQAKGPIKLRKIFTLKFPLSHFDVENHDEDEEEQSTGGQSKLMLPKDIDMPLKTVNTQVDYNFVALNSVAK